MLRAPACAATIRGQRLFKEICCVFTVTIAETTVEREIFAVKIVHVLNLCVENILQPDDSAMWRVYVYFIFVCLIFAA